VDLLIVGPLRFGSPTTISMRCKGAGGHRQLRQLPSGGWAPVVTIMQARWVSRCSGAAIHVIGAVLLVEQVAA
jgi:hypothetical protein